MLAGSSESNFGVTCTKCRPREFYTEFDSDALQIQLSILAESYHSFRQGEGMADTLHNVVDFLRKTLNI